jgi:hypothetical protein
MPAISSLVETYGGGSKDTTKFDAVTAIPPWIFDPSSGTDSQTGGENVLQPTDATAAYVGRSSVATDLDLDGDTCHIKLTQFELSQNSDFQIGLTNSSEESGQNFRFIYSRNFDAPVLILTFSNFGDNGTSVTLAFNSTDHVWLRWRVPIGGGNLFWEAAPEGVAPDIPGTWVPLRELNVDPGTPGTPFDFSTLRLYYGADNWNSQTGIQYAVDNLNYIGSAAPAAAPLLTLLGVG